MMNLENVLFAFGLTLFAGLATGIGSLFAFFAKEFNHKFLCGALGFSAGVMIYVSFVEILDNAKDILKASLGSKQGYSLTVFAFFAGIFIIGLIDRLVPSYENPHEYHHFKKGDKNYSDRKKLMRMGLFSAFAIAVHNFPEGLATFIGALADPQLGISIAVAIAIHNIPEGLAVSAPVYYATGSRKKAFVLSFLSGLSEPLGALIGYFVLRKFFNDITFGIVFAMTAGIMVYISLDELLPAAEEYGEHHIAMGGVIGGMVVMALSLLFLT